MKPEQPGLDIDQADDLLAYLRAAGRIGSTETPRLRRLEGGVSNRTVLVERVGGEAWIVKQALPKLRVAENWFSSPDRSHREALGIRWLSELAPPGAVPALVWEERSHHMLAMRAVPAPHANWKDLLLSGPAALEHVQEFGRLLGIIHRRGRERREELSAVFGDLSFFESLRIEPYYRFTATRVERASDFLLDLISETSRSRLTLVHGDYSPKNILVHAGRLVLLDHEVIHFGDPAFDIGFSSAHLLSKARHHVRARAAFLSGTRRYWIAYLDALGPAEWAPDLESRSVRHALGCLLARAAGRSPLEYLDLAQRMKQREAVVAIIGDPPATMVDLIDAWGEQLKVPHADH